MPESTTLYVIVNGQNYPFTPGQTLAGLVAKVFPGPGSVVVEHNGVIIPQEDLAKTRLNPEDRLELVYFVGGG